MQKGPDWKGTGLVPIKPVTTDSESGQAKIHVFGKNLEERVKTEDDNKDDNSSPLLFQFGNSQNTSESSQNIQDEDIETIKKRKFEAITGEEEETTVFQGDFKLFCWDLKTSNWIERGRGQLKLNDSAQDVTRKSRLIMRLGGTYRIILNVSINHSHFKVITNSKSNIRFTDGQNLWAASGQNAQVLKELIEKRIDILKKIKDTQTPETTIEPPATKPDNKKAKVVPEDEANNDVEDEKDKHNVEVATQDKEHKFSMDKEVDKKLTEDVKGEDLQDTESSANSDTDQLARCDEPNKDHAEVNESNSKTEIEKSDSEKNDPDEKTCDVSIDNPNEGDGQNNADSIPGKNQD